MKYEEENILNTINLADRVYLDPNYLQKQSRIKNLINQYLSLDHLHERLQDLPIQFQNPQPRPWQPIDWHTINNSQIIGIKSTVFISILVGAINTEFPIRSYTQTSRQYLEQIHPQLARFVGGVVDENGKIIELGLWEKEERQHSPALIKIYQQLTGNKFTPQPRTVKSYQPSDNPYEDLYLHGLHRIMTEYGAVCLYLWLMAHTTGTLQQVLSELLQDEVNHMTKFWGFGVWAFSESYFIRIWRTIKHCIFLKNSPQSSHLKSTKKLIITLRRMMGILNWNAWSWINKIEFVYTIICVMNRLLIWNKSLTPDYLQQQFGLSFDKY